MTPTPEEVLAGTAPFAVVCGDATEVLKSLPADAFHVCYCDPPYGLSSQDTNDVVACLTAWLSGNVYSHHGPGFMGKEWDAFVPGPEAWREVYRVLKPGAYCVAFSATRTVDLLGVAMRLAGLEVRNGWAWVFGQGFPKSLDVSKAIDKADAFDLDATTQYGPPITDAAKQWEGYGTDTKPAYEPLVVTRKPLEGTVASNVLAHGCGALNIDAARIGTSKDVPASGRALPRTDGWGMKGDETTAGFNPNIGRFPANLALVHDEGCVRVGTVKVKSNNAVLKNTVEGELLTSYGGGLKQRPHGEYGYADPDGTETVDHWECAETCAVAELGRQSAAAGVHSAGSARGGGLGTEGRKSMFIPNGETNGSRYGDTGTAARFFYQGKASAKDRLAYLTCSPDCTANNTVAPAKDASEKMCPVCKNTRTVYLHPTVKPYELALHHAKLLSLPPHVQPVAVVPFCGTGIEARALLDAGFRVIAIDIDPRHVAMTTYRLGGEQPVREEPVPRETPAPVTAPLTLDDLFGF